MGSSSVSNQGDNWEKTITPEYPNDGILKAIKLSAGITLENNSDNKLIVDAYCKTTESSPQDIERLTLTKGDGEYGVHGQGPGLFSGTIKFPNDKSVLSRHLAIASWPIDEVDSYKIRVHDANDDNIYPKGNLAPDYVITPQCSTRDTFCPVHPLQTERYRWDWDSPLKTHMETLDLKINLPKRKMDRPHESEDFSRSESSVLDGAKIDGATSAMSSSYLETVDGRRDSRTTRMDDQFPSTLRGRRDIGALRTIVSLLHGDALMQKVKGWRDSGLKNVKRMWPGRLFNHFGSRGTKESKASVRWGKGVSGRPAHDQTDRKHIASAKSSASARTVDHVDSAQESREAIGTGSRAPKHLSFWVQNQGGEWEKWTSKKNAPSQCDGLYCPGVSGSAGNNQNYYQLIDVRFTNQGREVRTNGECLSLALRKDSLQTTESETAIEQAVRTGEGVTINPEDGAVRLAEQAPLRPLHDTAPEVFLNKREARRVAKLVHPDHRVLPSTQASTHNRKTSRTK